MLPSALSFEAPGVAVGASQSVSDALVSAGRRLGVEYFSQAEVDEILASATSAVREAENGGDFVASVRRDLGIRVRVISGKEEARLIHLAAAYAAGVGGHPTVVIDIGGGSVEITMGTAARMQVGESFKVGVIRLTERFVTSDPLSRADEQRLVRHIRRQTDELAPESGRRADERDPRARLDAQFPDERRAGIAGQRHGEEIRKSII